MTTFLILISKVFFTSKVLFYLYPILNLFYKPFKKTDIINKIIKIHNGIVLKKIKNIKKVLIILPHCIQNSACIYRVTGALIENCKSCGACQVSDFLKFKNQDFKLNVYIANGGTIARQLIINNKPDFIIAIACEKDLISGIKDVKKIPTALILNQRPYGPCKDTCVDLNKVKILLDKILV